MSSCFLSSFVSVKVKLYSCLCSCLCLIMIKFYILGNGVPLLPVNCSTL